MGAILQSAKTLPEIGRSPKKPGALDAALRNAVRLALAAPTMDQLDSGLRTLAGMLNAKEDDFASTE
jgi:hypothetical protein